MKLELRENLAGLKSKVDLDIFAPIFSILTLVALFNSLQNYYALPTEAISVTYLIRIILTKLFYFWYFILLALVIYYLSKKVSLTSQTYFWWSIIHLLTLIVSFIIHEAISISIDILIWSKSPPGTLYLIFNNPFIWIEVLVYALLLLSFSLIEYRRISNENEIKCSQLEIQLVRSKLKELRSKIQPSFLFNTLQSILDMVRKNRGRDANQILSLLSDFLRTTIYDTERDEITLDEEVKYLLQYLEIEKVRKQAELEINMDIESSVLDAKVPNYLLQPIIEGLIYLSDEKNYGLHEILIKSIRMGKDLELTIGCNYDQSVKFEEIKNIKIPVLEITKERLTQLYGKKHELSIVENSKYRFLVKIIIPFRRMDIESEGKFVMESAA